MLEVRMRCTYVRTYPHHEINACTHQFGVGSPDTLCCAALLLLLLYTRYHTVYTHATRTRGIICWCLLCACCVLSRTHQTVFFFFSHVRTQRHVKRRAHHQHISTSAHITQCPTRFFILLTEKEILDTWYCCSSTYPTAD